MRISPFRLLTFWLGLPLLLFLIGAWWDSMHYRSAIFIPTANFELSIGSSRGAVGYVFTRDLGSSLRYKGGDYVPLTKTTAYRDELSEWTNPPGAWDAPAITTKSPFGGSSVFILAWWFVVLLYLILWTGLMVWRVRRWSKLTAHAA